MTADKMNHKEFFDIFGDITLQHARIYSDGSDIYGTIDLTVKDFYQAIKERLLEEMREDDRTRND